jgi:hypothetical protein
MKEYWWWILSAFLACAISATEVYNCSWKSATLYSCDLISEPEQINIQEYSPPKLFEVDDEKEEYDFKKIDFGDRQGTWDF